MIKVNETKNNKTNNNRVLSQQPCTMITQYSAVQLHYMRLET